MSTEQFDVRNITLQQRNIIEASAGTGKTFSIAILALRLILEKRTGADDTLSLPQILMVTFTRNAVAELELRIRSFIRQAYNYSLGDNRGVEDIIIALVDEAIDKDQTKRGDVQQALKKALLELDETNILTIHSFCQRVLTEQAFDTGQIFDARALTGADFDELRQRIYREWWRDEIQTIDRRLYEILADVGLNYNQYEDILDKVMSGKKMRTNQIYQNEFRPEGQRLFLTDITARFDAPLDEIKKQVMDYLETNWIDLKKSFKDKGFNNVPTSLFNDLSLLYKNLIIYWDALATLPKIFSKVAPEILTIRSIMENRRAEARIYLEKMYIYAITAVQERMEDCKNRYGVIFFDDMINRLRNAVIDKPELKQVLTEKYKAVFIDEFQDTDSAQYDIFSGMFGSETLLFYIGDPKQSIYGFRSADIHTYFRARETGVDRKLVMNRNFRSAKNVIHALNRFFLPHENFDTFYTCADNDASKQINYETVDTPDGQLEYALTLQNNPHPPLTLTQVEKADLLPEAAALHVVSLLKENYQIETKEENRKVRLKDIAILVRWNSEGSDVKRALRRFNIPAVCVDENKVLKSDEAKAIMYILEAVYDINKNNIHRALLISQTDMTIDRLLSLDEFELWERFNSYKKQWLDKQGGVYVMLMKYMADFGIRGYLLNDETENGDRMLSNMLQLIEILHGIEYQREYSPIELIRWLKRALQGEEQQGDEYEQRIESDEESVKIITIHKSKGLEYPIVVAPFLDMTSIVGPKAVNKKVQYRNEIDGQYYFGTYADLDQQEKDWYIKQTEQENRRLLYVALTRTKYACHLIHAKDKPGSTLDTFLQAVNQAQKASGETIIAEQLLYYPDGFRYQSKQETTALPYRVPEAFRLHREYWRKMSYSALNPEHTSVYMPAIDSSLKGYDQFVFAELKRGAAVGNRLHELFERIDFAKEESWTFPVERVADQVSKLPKDKATPFIQEMLRQVVNAKLQTKEDIFSLAEVSMKKRIPELEFDYTVSAFLPAHLEEMAPVQTPWRIKHTDELEGMMNGFIDLLFEHNGKYYILDWKSNYLGNALSQYDQAGLQQAMNENNYHLQYHIYTLAVYKYLKMRLPNFDYEKHFGGVFYLFLRGLRAGESTGVYFHKPEASLVVDLINRMSGNPSAAV